MTDSDPLAESFVTLFRLGLATVVGGVLGLNRELHHKAAGMRTHALVSLGSALATFFSIEMVNSGKGQDIGSVTRVVQGVVTGIGFIGAGVIYREDGGKTVKGLTTAASIWVVACLGMACGAGRLIPVLIACGITLFVLVYGGPIERFAHRKLFPEDLEDKPTPSKYEGL